MNRTGSAVSRLTVSIAQRLSELDQAAAVGRDLPPLEDSAATKFDRSRLVDSQNGEMLEGAASVAPGCPLSRTAVRNFVGESGARQTNPRFGVKIVLPNMILRSAVPHTRLPAATEPAAPHPDWTIEGSRQDWRRPSMGFVSESQLRTGLPALAKGIRTRGPSLAGKRPEGLEARSRRNRAQAQSSSTVPVRFPDAPGGS